VAESPPQTTEESGFSTYQGVFMTAEAQNIKPVTFSELGIGQHFVFADSPALDTKEKIGPDKWKFVDHSGLVPCPVFSRHDREVIVRVAGPQ
jgi:hypothetical protein